MFVGTRFFMKPVDMNQAWSRPKPREMTASSLYVELDHEYEKLLEDYFSHWNENMAEANPYFERIRPQIHGHEF